VSQGLLEQGTFASPRIADTFRARKVKVTYIVGSLRDAGAERRTLELVKNLDHNHFVPSIILMEDVGMDRARHLTDRHFAMGIPEGGNSRWISRGLPLARAVWKTRSQLIAWKSDIVHAMLPGPSIVGGIAARMAGVPILIGARPCLVSLYHSGNGILSIADKIAFRIAHLNLANSMAGGREMVNIGGCPPEKAYTIYNGVDTRRFHPDLSRSWRTEMGWTDENMVFGMIANFRNYKRHEDFVSAAAVINKSHPTSRFVLVGADFGSKADVERQVKELGLTGKIHIVDGVSSPERIFAALDVYVCTSDTEGFSNVILEAMACGKPVIATNVGGNPEAVLDQETGLLVPSRDPEAVANAARALLQDQERRCTMGAMGRLRVEGVFSMEHMIAAHQQLYMQLISKTKEFSQ
jgi:glycosyltransferase involved in cell wall biosynthesis